MYSRVRSLVAAAKWILRLPVYKHCYDFYRGVRGLRKNGDGVSLQDFSRIDALGAIASSKLVGTLYAFICTYPLPTQLKCHRGKAEASRRET